MTPITCKNVSFSYDGNTVVSGLNFAVASGVIFASWVKTALAKVRL